MSRRNKGGDEDTGTWLNTYADMVTLLLTFFIVMYSMSSVNQEKFQALVKVLTGNDPNGKQVVILQNDSSTSSGASGYVSGATASGSESLPNTMDALYLYLSNYVKNNKKEADIEVTKNGTGVVYIKFSNAMMFKPDDFVLTKEARVALDFLGRGLKNMESKIQRIQVEGHTADTGDPNYPVNDWKLSGERAASVVTFLGDDKNIKESLFLSIGYGNSHPTADNSTEAGRIKNRRVEIKIYGTESNLKAADAILAGTYDPSKYPTAEGNLGKTTTSKTTSQPASSKASVSSGAASAQSKVSPYKD